MYPRFRGRHRLHRHANGLEKCVGCSLCAAACPADCIRVVPAENTPDNRVSPGERYARIYEINMSRCIFCGYCEIACPFDAITLGNEYEISEYNRDDQIYTKDMLLAEPIKKIAGLRPRPLRHADPVLQGQQLIVASASNVVVWIVWFAAAFACLASAIGVVSMRNPFFSALALIGNLGSLAVLYLLLSAEFVAAAQVLVYAGAVMVMFLFVIAYLGGEADAPFAGRRGWQTIGAIVAAAAILVEVIVAIGRQTGGRLSHEADIALVLRQPGADRAPVPDRPPARLRGHVDRPARRGGRRRDPRPPLAQARAAGDDARA